MSNAGKKIKMLSHQQIVNITLYASKNKSSLDGLTPDKAYEVIKVALGVDSNIVSVCNVLKQSGVVLNTRRQTGRAPNGEPKKPRVHNIAQWLKHLYEKLGEPVPKALEEMCHVKTGPEL